MPSGNSRGFLFFLAPPAPPAGATLTPSRSLPAAPPASACARSGTGGGAAAARSAAGRGGRGCGGAAGGGGLGAERAAGGAAVAAAGGAALCGLTSSAEVMTEPQAGHLPRPLNSAAGRFWAFCRMRLACRRAGWWAGKRRERQAEQWSGKERRPEASSGASAASRPAGWPLQAQGAAARAASQTQRPRVPACLAGVGGCRHRHLLEVSEDAVHVEAGLPPAARQAAGACEGRRRGGSEVRRVG